MDTEVKYTIELREARAEDMAEVKQIYRDTISAICQNDYNEEQLKVWIAGVENEGRWTAIFQEQYFVLAEMEGKIVGFITLDKGIYIDLLYVHKDYQRRGIANTLLSKIENTALRLNSSILTANVSKTARPFFERNGFKVVCENINNIKGIEIINYSMRKGLTSEGSGE
jgi:putative acetyltransferase